MENPQNLFDTLVANLPTIVMVFFGIVVLWNLIGGYRKGTARQATRMLTVVLSFLICFYGFRAGAAWLQSQIEGVTVGELLARYEGAEGIFSALPEAARSVLLSLDSQTAEAVLALPLAVVALPVAFTVMFLFLCLVTKLVYLLLVLIGGLRKKKIAFGSRLCGMLLGAVQGVAIAVVLLMPGVGILIEPFPAAVLVFSINEGAYCAETIRAALESVPKGQMEAGQCVGMSYLQIIRRIILPQALRTAFPTLASTLIAMVKDTSLAANITVTEMFMTTQRIVARTYEPLALYMEVGLVYLLFCTVLTRLQAVGERYLNSKGTQRS